MEAVAWLTESNGHVRKVYGYVTSDVRLPAWYSEIHIWCVLEIAARSLVELNARTRPLAVSCLFHFPLLGISSPPPSSRQWRRDSTDARLLNQTYGKNRPPSFLYRCAHYSLKIPPKKRRRFSKTYWPLSHVSKAKHFGWVPWIQ